MQETIGSPAVEKAKMLFIGGLTLILSAGFLLNAMYSRQQVLTNGHTGVKRIRVLGKDK